MFTSRIDMINSLNRRTLAIATCALLLLVILPLAYLSPAFMAPTTFKMSLSSNPETADTIDVPAAAYLTPELLRERKTSGRLQRTARGLPKVIHQSWVDTDLPIKFKHWSDSWRVKHPDWIWVRVLLADWPCVADLACRCYGPTTITVK